MSATGLLDKRLVFVTGKGGVGKSTVAAALGLRAARTGRRTIVAEIGGRGDVQRMFGARSAAAAGELELAPGLFTTAIEPRRALEEYLADQLPTRALAELLAASRTLEARSGERLAGLVADNLRDHQALVRRDRRGVERLAAELAGPPFAWVPQLVGEVNDLRGLGAVAARLFAG